MKTPWHLWVVGIAALLWSAMGAADYVLTRTARAGYVANMPDGLLAYIQAYPFWMGATWALAVWLPVAGAVLLLLRSRLAAPVFLLDLPFIALAGLYNYILAEPKLNEIAGNGAIGFWIVISVIAVALWLYTRAMVSRGHLH